MENVCTDTDKARGTIPPVTLRTTLNPDEDTTPLTGMMTNIDLTDTLGSDDDIDITDIINNIKIRPHPKNPNLISAFNQS